MAQPTIPTAAIIAVCDDLRARAPKQTALTVRYLVTMIVNPGLSAVEYHKEVTGDAQYGHGNTVLKGLHDLGYIHLTNPISPNDGSLYLSPRTQELFQLAGLSSPSGAEKRVEVSRLADRLRVSTRYHPALPGRASKVGGQFRKDGEFWDFSLGQEPSVRDIYLDIFGEFEVLAPRTVLHCKGPLDALIDEGTNSESLYIAGMKVASITRKGRLWLAQTATVIKGTVGVNDSPKKITSTPETRIDILGVPESLALKLNQRYPDQVSYSLL